eukprot:3117329-Prymnesium_polylepis.5
MARECGFGRVIVPSRPEGDRTTMLEAWAVCCVEPQRACHRTASAIGHFDWPWRGRCASHEGFGKCFTGRSRKRTVYRGSR